MKRIVIVLLLLLFALPLDAEIIGNGNSTTTDTLSGLMFRKHDDGSNVAYAKNVFNVSNEIDKEKIDLGGRSAGFYFLGAAITILIGLIGLVIFIIKKMDMPPEEYQKLRAEIKGENFIGSWGNINPILICPHCQTKGFVRTVPVKRKKGISGAKATGALLTFGVSMLATGLSRKETMTQAHCENCGSTWDF